MVTVGQLRRELFDLYDRYFNSELNDGYHKSSEGRVSIVYPHYFEEQWPPAVEIYSYVFGEGRNHYFDTIDDAFETVKKWRRDLEEEILNPQEEQW